MYALVDRPVENLTNSGRFLLWAMRGWAHAATRGACPPQALRRGFADTGALAALPDFHAAMALLATGAAAPIELAPMPCVQISEHEAILLGLWRDFSVEGETAARATLALLVGNSSVGPVAQAMRAAIERLAFAGFHPSVLTAGAMKHQESPK